MTFQSFSLIEAPESAAIMFLSGCKMSCPYCYNQELRVREEVNVDEGKDFIDSLFRTSFDGATRSKVDYVVFSGGECTEHPLELQELIRYTKERGLKTGVYTNGTHQEILKSSWDLIDFINIDYKWDVQSHRYGFNELMNLMDLMIFSLDNEREGQVIRINTTVLNSFHTEEVIVSMARYLEKMLVQTSTRSGETRIKMVPMEEWSPKETQWTLSSFFRGKGTLGNVTNEETTKEERWTLINKCLRRMDESSTTSSS